MTDTDNKGGFPHSRLNFSSDNIQLIDIIFIKVHNPDSIIIRRSEIFSKGVQELDDTIGVGQKPDHSRRSSEERSAHRTTVNH